jgi:hypothetical protein
MHSPTLKPTCEYHSTPQHEDEQHNSKEQLYCIQELILGKITQGDPKSSNVQPIPLP